MLLSWREKFHTSGYSIGQWIKAYQLTGFSISYQKGICWLLYLCAAYGIFLSILVNHIASWSSSAWEIRNVSLDIVSSIYYLQICQLDEPYECCALVMSSPLYSSRIWCSLLVTSVWMNLQRNLLDGIFVQEGLFIILYIVMRLG